MKVRIVNDSGVGNGTRIIDEATGEDLGVRATRAVVYLSVGEPVRAEITVVTPMVDLVAYAIIVEVCPRCGREYDVDD